MAHFETTLDTRAKADVAFDYLADFSNAREWDPSVTAATRIGSEPIGPGTRFALELALAGRTLHFEYEIQRYEPNRLLVFCSESERLRSLDTIEIQARSWGCRVRYDADLRLAGSYYLFDPIVHLAFQVSGARSARGLEQALDALG